MPRRAEYDQFAVDQLIAGRSGVVRLGELRDLGMPVRTIHHRVRAGRWSRLLPGVVLTASGSASHHQRLTAALVYAGAGAILTGPSALRLRGIRAAPRTEEIHVLIPHGRRQSSAEGVLVERTRRLPHPVTVNGHPSAPLARACIDACRRMRDLDQVRALIAELVQRRRVTVQELAEEIRAAQVRGTALPRAVVAEVSAGVRSAAEAQVRRLIRASRIPEPLWNQEVFDLHGSWLATPDGLWFRQGVALEIDSLEWHLSPAHYERTQARQRLMSAAGLLVIPVTPGFARRQGADLLEDLGQALAAGALRPTPRIRLTRAA